MDSQAEDAVWAILSTSFSNNEAIVYRDYKLPTVEGAVREFDFLVLHRSLGIIVIEVKAYRFEDIRATDDSGWLIKAHGRTILRSNPLEQARNGVLGALKLVDNKLNGFRVACSALVILPNIERKSWENLKELDDQPFLFEDDLKTDVFETRFTELVLMQNSQHSLGKQQPITEDQWQTLQGILHPQYLLDNKSLTSTSSRKRSNTASRIPRSTPATNQGIFISYRRQDSAWAAGRIFATLDRDFPGKVFWDTATIKLGVDWHEAIDDALEKSIVLLAIIGDKWTTVKLPDGTLRLFDPDDKLVQEIKVALDKGVTVIPILLDNTPVPKDDELPSSIQKLNRKQALQISPDNFEYRMGILINRINELITLGKI